MIRWQRPIARPNDKMLCLIMVNGRIVPDVFVYQLRSDVFSVWNLVDKDLTEMPVKRAEVDAWMCTADIPPPKWVKNGRH